MKNILKNITIFISMVGFLLSDPYKPLDIEFLKEKTTQNTLSTKNEAPNQKKDNPKAFENMINILKGGQEGG